VVVGLPGIGGWRGSTGLGRDHADPGVDGVGGSEAGALVGGGKAGESSQFPCQCCCALNLHPNFEVSSRILTST
jgi:hypothetical protein